MTELRRFLSEPGYINERHKGFRSGAASETDDAPAEETNEDSEDGDE